MTHAVRAALSLLLAMALLPACALGEQTIVEDFEEGYWFFEDPSQGVRIEIHRREDTENRVLWYEADLQCSPDSPLLFLTANQEKPGKGFHYPERILRDHQAVFGVNDDMFGHRMYNHETVGVIVRGGEVLSERTRRSGSRGWPTLDTAAFFDDGSMRVFESAEHTGEEYLAMGAHTVLAFGPWLVRNGEVNPALAKSYRTKEPRSAIGMIAPCHYVVLSVEGRVKQSGGVNVQWLADRMAALGATEALNLDGGRTCSIVFMGKSILINNPKGLVRKGRSVSGMVALGTSAQVPPYTGVED